MFSLIPYRRGNKLSLNDDFWGFGRNVIENFFNDPFFSGVLSATSGIRADIRENDKEYIVDAEIPGVNKEDINVELRDDTLTISIDRGEEIKDEGENYIRRERRYGSVSRSFYVENVVNDAVTARYKDGILTIVLPKDKKAKKNKHRIPVQ
ncbi:Hsp20/alpha crystallin family protein [Acetivibrio saccincola]|jgi:HSP20 family protein|uniref:18 kDa heat shock protein n=1 Tax=Acetivibrio saccincola TaxID=1677857 RepID=A0A2K9ET25_9FIRM|nr:Hsp20/alpha crystallin family protein [Acetivibrio saccincola]AUG58700.1 18 kDa heat shock protein [Acetivibrio saccincola]NLW26998.1 Hsp20/alpha crystallin family protein [Acetivibrio saccincola]PQQ66197.1 heat-shock protein Hsp20 [Acetivibrio saccincola]HOA96963.1 Hsp20/alpha crystallin family protein [Acetivibrio saccincola]HQD29014.1 Hsp20/alpha crystallin family protein [Acetivibrio saccincola]